MIYVNSYRFWIFFGVMISDIILITNNNSILLMKVWCCLVSFIHRSFGSFQLFGWSGSKSNNKWQNPKTKRQKNRRKQKISREERKKRKRENLIKWNCINFNQMLCRFWSFRFWIRGIIQWLTLIVVAVQNVNFDPCGHINQLDEVTHFSSWICEKRTTFIFWICIKSYFV